MTDFLRNPTTTQSRPRSAGLYYARRLRRARVVQQNLTPWSSGLSVSAGQYVQNAGLAFQAQNSGTTGHDAPTQAAGVFDDGSPGISWLAIPTTALIDFILTAPPTP
jgi:hypothetical protein